MRGVAAERRRHLRRRRLRETQLLRAQPPLVLVVQDLEQAGDTTGVDDRDEHEALVAVAAEYGHLGRVGQRVTDVDHRRARPRRAPARPAGGAPAPRRPSRAEVVAGGVPHRQDLEPPVRAHGGDHAAPGVEQARRRGARARSRTSGRVRVADQQAAAGQAVELPLAGEARREVVAPAEEVGELVDVLLLDAPVSARGPAARQEPGVRPAADGVGRHAEPLRGALDAEVHRCSYDGSAGCRPTPGSGRARRRRPRARPRRAPRRAPGARPGRPPAAAGSVAVRVTPAPAGSAATSSPAPSAGLACRRRAVRRRRRRRSRRRPRRRRPRRRAPRTPSRRPAPSTRRARRAPARARHAAARPRRGPAAACRRPRRCAAAPRTGARS